MKTYKIREKKQSSCLTVDCNGYIHLKLMQLLGDNSNLSQQMDASQLLSKHLQEAATKNSIVVIPTIQGLKSLQSEVKNAALRCPIVGFHTNDNLKIQISTEKKQVKQHKFSFSKADHSLNHCANREPGKRLHLFCKPNGSESPVRWAVLNCHDYTHVDLIKIIQKYEIELLIVVSFNSATRLYKEYALADTHRLFCYVVIANSAEFGGSAVFAPFKKVKTNNHDNKYANIEGQIFGCDGATELQVSIPLNIKELRELRDGLSRSGVQYTKNNTGQIIPMIPPQQFLLTEGAQPGLIKDLKVKDHRFSWDSSHLRIAVAQLNFMDLDVYFDTSYRIRNHKKCVAFEALLRQRLKELKHRCIHHLDNNKIGNPLDILVFPEVFIPRSFIPKLERFSKDMGTTIIAGVDYPDGGEDENANECIIIRPGKKNRFYRKISRSQYDALKKNSDKSISFMAMNRGDTLMRFVDKNGRGIGVLICYDFSHAELMNKINLHDREEPLDVIIVVANNPYGALYKSCCIADAHRYYQYIVMCNVSPYGGSGIYGPIRDKGEKQVVMTAGKGVETICVADLDLERLRHNRKLSLSESSDEVFMSPPGVLQKRFQTQDG